MSIGTIVTMKIISYRLIYLAMLVNSQYNSKMYTPQCMCHTGYTFSASKVILLSAKIFFVVDKFIRLLNSRFVAVNKKN